LRKKAVGMAFAILVAATLLVAYLGGGSASRTGTSTSTLSAFTYQTVKSSTSYSTKVQNNITTTFTIVLASTVNATWVPGQPIPVSDVETADVPVGGRLAIAVNADASRVYLLGTSSLTVVEASSHSVIANITFPSNNTGGIVNAGLAVDYSTGMVYASVQGRVVEVNGHTNTVVGEIPLSLGTLAFDSATHVLWGTVMQHQSPLEAQTGGLVGVDVRTGSIVANVSIGFAPFGIALDPSTHMVYADGCTGSFVCGSEAAIVNGTSGTLVTTVSLQSGYYPTMTMNPRTNVVYISGDEQLVAFNGTNGSVIFRSNPQTCGPFAAMAVIASSNQVLMVPQNYDYLLVYDGTSGALVNMYSFPSPLGPVAYNTNTHEVYVAAASGGLLSLHDVQVTGNVNATLIGAGQRCGLP
jgi:hypothetical protein